MAAVAAAYGNALRNGFVWDDLNLIVANPAIKSWREVPKLPFSVLLPAAEYYRPVQALTFLLDYHLWGLWPAGFHLTSIAVHGAVSVLLYSFVVRLFADWRAALAAALLFAVHPIHTEAVTYVSGRTDPLAALFMLAALSWMLEPRRPLLAAAAFAIALLSRESATVLVLLVPLVLVAASRADTNLRGRGREIVARCLPFLAVVAAYGVVRSIVVERVITRETSGLSLGARLLTLPEVVVTYLGLVVAPIHLHMERSLPPASLGDPRTWGALAVLVAFGAAVVALRRSAGPVSFGVAWFAVALLPVANIVPLATFLAEHWLYVPSMGLFLAAGWTIVHAAPRGRSAFVILVLLSIAYGARTARRNADWLDERTLLESTLEFAPDSARVHANLGRVYLAAGDVARAKIALARAVELEPSHVRSYDAYNQLGVIAQREGRPEDAIHYYRQAIELNERPAAAYTNLASALGELGRPDEARQALEAALVADPNLAVAHLNLGNTYAVAGDLGAARKEFERAIELDPDLALAYVNLGRVHLIERRAGQAEQAFRRALDLEPDSQRARSGLESALAMRREAQANPH